MKRLAILLSGRGSNFLAIHGAVDRKELDAEIVAVISNRPDAAGLQRARELGLAAHLIDHRSFADRHAHEADVAHVIDQSRAAFIALAGYMRMLSPEFVARYRNRIVNIHPSLLPAFPGVNAQAQAIAHGVKISGCTVHFVDETLDGGPIIEQRALEVRDEDTDETLAARILVEEHKAYVDALRRICKGNYRIDGRRVLFT